MKSKSSITKIENILGIISFTIPLIIFMLILNWFFKITPYQKLEGMPLLIAPFVGLIGLILSLLTLKKLSNKFVKIGIISNAILIILPFLYIFLGTIIGGV